MQKNNTEVNNCLESIPEWGDYQEQDLKPRTDLEKKPLASDPRNKGSFKDEDDLEFFFRLKSFNPAKGGQNQKQLDNKNEIEEEENNNANKDTAEEKKDSDEEEEDDFDRMMHNF